MKTFLGCDGLPLKGDLFEVEAPKGLIICVHGMAEHRKRYEEFAGEFNKKGYLVLTYDQRGHGESTLENESLGYLGDDGFIKLVEDLNLIIDGSDKDLPIFLLGHSMGSFVVQKYLQTYQHQVTGAILLGTSYKTFGTRFAKLLTKVRLRRNKGREKGHLFNQLIFGGYNKPFKPNRTSMDWLNRLDDEVDQYLRDPYCGFVFSNQFYHDLFKGLISLYKDRNLEKVENDLPLLMLAGLEDPVGGNGRKVKDLYGTYRKLNKNVELKLYSGARHELLLERNKAEVFQDIYTWLERINR